SSSTSALGPRPRRRPCPAAGRSPAAFICPSKENPERLGEQIRQFTQEGCAGVQVEAAGEAEERSRGAAVPRRGAPAEHQHGNRQRQEQFVCVEAAEVTRHEGGCSGGTG